VSPFQRPPLQRPENWLVEGVTMSIERDLNDAGYLATFSDTLDSTRITIWKAVKPHQGSDWSFPPAARAEVFVRERAEVLESLHYRSITSVCPQSGAVKLFAFASLSPDDPRVRLVDNGKKLLVGSYQTLYGLNTEGSGIDFEVVLPEGGEVSQLEVARRVIDEVALVVSETTVRCISAGGAVLWVMHFDDRVKIVDITADVAVCQSLEPGASGIPWTCVLDLYSGGG
jgi:hypothetical protein